MVCVLSSFSLLSDLQGFSQVPETNFIDLYAENIFYPVACLSTLAMVSLVRQKFVILIQANVFIIFGFFFCFLFKQSFSLLSHKYILLVNITQNTWSQCLFSSFLLQVSQRFFIAFKKVRYNYCRRFGKSRKNTNQYNYQITFKLILILLFRTSPTRTTLFIASFYITASSMFCGGQG